MVRWIVHIFLLEILANFLLLSCLDPDKYGDIDALKLQYAELTPAKVEEIRGFLKPYFLRRTKDMVLDLPPMSEVVLPVTMTPLQRTMYRSLLERNASAISSLYQKAQGSKQSKTNLYISFLFLSTPLSRADPLNFCTVIT